MIPKLLNPGVLFNFVALVEGEIIVCVCVTVSPALLLDEIEASESEGNDDRVEGLLCGAVKQLKMNRAKPDTTLYLSLMFLAKIKPNVFATEGIIEVGVLGGFVQSSTS